MKKYRRVLALLLVFFLVAVLCACGEKSHEEKQNDYDLAADYVYQGDYDKAIALFEELKGFSDSAQYAVYAKALKLGFSGDCETAIAQLESLKSYRQSEQYVIYFEALAQEAQQNFEQAGNIYGAIPLFADVPDRISALPQKISERDYAFAAKKYEDGEYADAKAMFASLGGFKDSAARARQCDADSLYADGKTAEAYGIYKALDKAYFTHAGEYAAIYNIAGEAFEKGDYDAALSDYTRLGTYSDSVQKLNETKKEIEKCEGDYAAALELKDAERFEEAIDAFAALNDGRGFRDSHDQVADCSTAINERDYAAALMLKDTGDYAEALKVFNAVNGGSGYKDSAELAAQCQTAIDENNYALALSLRDEGELAEAIALFEALSDFSDASQQLSATKYELAERYDLEGNYEAAYYVYAQLHGYEDVDEILKSDEHMVALSEIDAEWAVGNTVVFGTWEQGGDGEDSAEPIEWLVLDRFIDGSALVISKYALDGKPFHGENTDITWEDCSLRTWLNGEFCDTVFSDAERDRLHLADVAAEKNPPYFLEPGNDTQDHVFLLSFAQAEQYFTDDKTRMCVPTQYAVTHGADQSVNYTVDGIGACWWWLRSVGSSAGNATVVGLDGRLSDYGRSVDTLSGSVRPAVLVQPF